MTAQSITLLKRQETTEKSKNQKSSEGAKGLTKNPVAFRQCSMTTTERTNRCLERWHVHTRKPVRFFGSERLLSVKYGESAIQTTDRDVCATLRWYLPHLLVWYSDALT